MGGMRTPERLRVHTLIDSLGMGGAEFLLGELAAGASAAGIDLTVGYLQGRPADRAERRLRERGVHPVHVPVSSLVAPGGYLRVRRHLRAVGPDLVHTHLGSSDCVGGIAARSLGIPAVSTVHIMEWPRTRRNDLRVGLISAARRRCMARVIGVSEPARRWLGERRWARPEQLVTVHNGVGGVARPGAGREIRRALGIAEDALVVTMLSVLREAKGHDLGIPVIVALRERFPGLHLLIVGDGPARSRLEALAAPHSGTITLAGHRDDVMEVLDASDVLLHPSRIDAFPGALLEAMAAGVPVVATAVGGIPEIVEHGRTGLLVSPPPVPARFEEALAPLLADPGLRADLGREGRRRFERHFSVERWVERLRDLYEQVLRESGAPGSVNRAAEAARRRP
jgi:glycosyltransferase involved in cell wall biosynthesis